MNGGTSPEVVAFENEGAHGPCPCLNQRWPDTARPKKAIMTVGGSILAAILRGRGCSRAPRETARTQIAFRGM